MIASTQERPASVAPLLAKHWTVFVQYQLRVRGASAIQVDEQLRRREARRLDVQADRVELLA